MAAFHTHRPVTVTVGAAWTFYLDPRPHPRKTSSVTGIACLVAFVTRLVFGVVFYRDCPQEPNIPVYLIGMSVLTLISVFIMMCQSKATPASGFLAGLVCVMGLGACIWIMAGNVRIFLAYQPNYAPTAADGLYCNKTLYTFAFWNAVWETFSLVVIVARMCGGLLLAVTVRPVPTDRDFYGNV